MDFKIIDAHSHLWLRQDTEVNGLPIRTLPGNGSRSEFMGEERQMLPPFMIDGRNTAEVFLSNMDYAQVSAAVVTQEFIDGIQNDYLWEVSQRYPDRFFVCGMCEFRRPGFLRQAQELIDKGFKAIKIPGHRLFLPGGRVMLNSPEMMQMFHLMEEVEGPLVLDADGLNALEGQVQRLKARRGLTVLTPHDGEFARLAGCSLPLNDRVEQAVHLAQETGCVVVLKGHESLTVDPRGRVWRNTTGNPGMAKGGSGDILAGMIASLLGQKQLTGCVSCPGELVAWAVYLHGAAGDAAAARCGEYGMLPDDTLAAVAGVLQIHIQDELQTN